MLKNESSR